MMQEKSTTVLTSNLLIDTVNQSFDNNRKVAIETLSMVINEVVTCKEKISQLQGEVNILQQKNDVLESKLSELNK